MIPLPATGLRAFGRSTGLPAVAVLVVLHGCAGVPPPRESGEAVAGAVREALVAQLSLREDGIRSVRGIAAVEVAFSAETRRFREALALRSDGRFRLETLGALGLPVLIIASDGDRVTVIGAPQASGASSDGCPLVHHLLGLRLPPAALGRLLAGLPPLPVAPSSLVFRLPERQAYLVEREEAGRVQRLYVEPSGALTGGEIWEGGRGLGFAFTGTRAIDGLVFPMRIALTQLQGAVSVTVSYQAIELNPVLADHLFTFPGSTPVSGGNC